MAARAMLAGLALAFAASVAAHAAQPSAGFAARPTASGFDLVRGGEAIHVTALRPDVLRVRIDRAGAPARDESWAALPSARAARAATHGCGDGCFETAALRVRADLVTGGLTITDAAGRVVLADDGGPFRPAGAGFRLDKRLGAETHVFGLGDKMGPLDRRGRVFSLWNTDAYRYQESTDPLYKAIPVFMTVDAGRAAGVFLDDTWRSVFDFGVERPDVMSFGADGGGIDYYVFAGPDPKAVLAQYAWLTGAPPLPPLWAFGFQQSRFSYGSDAEARAVADRLRRDRIPADVLWFDIGVLDRKRAFTIDRSQFPDFARLVGDLDRQGLKSVVIADLHLAAEPGYAPFDSGVAGDHFVKTADGARYVGPVWPGPSVFPDFSRAQTRRWWGGLFADLYDRVGVAGVWNDMNEPSVFTPAKTMPPQVRHRIDEPGFAPRIATHAEIHNVYGLLNSEATYEGLLALKPDQRPFVMTRATYAGGQRYAVTWTGDNSATWNHLRLSTPQLLSLGLSGFAFAGDDLGGFAGSPSTDLLTRWLEVGAFNPIMRDHSDAGTAPQEPWAGGEAAEAVRRRYIEARYRLLPYIYTAAEETSRTGAPMMRPLFMEFPQAAQGRPLDLDAPSEFMLGRALLVAPSPWPESPDAYAVTLPPGDWYDFWTGLKVEAAAPAERTGASGVTSAVGGDDAAAAVRSLQVTPTLATLPVYVRAGAIIPSQPLVQSTSQIPQGPLRLDVYPGPDCHGEVYADDGVSRGYLRGASLRQAFTCTVQGDAVTVTLAPPQGRYRPWWTRLDVAVHGASPRLRLTRSPAGAATPRYDAAARTLAVQFPEPRSGPTILAFSVR